MRVGQEITVICKGEAVTAVVLSLPIAVSRRFEWRQSSEEEDEIAVEVSQPYFKEGTALVDLEGTTWAKGWEHETGVALLATNALWRAGRP